MYAKWRFNYLITLMDVPWQRPKRNRYPIWKKSMALKLDTSSNFRVLLSIVCLFAGIASLDLNLKYNYVCFKNVVTWHKKIFSSLLLWCLSEIFLVPLPYSFWTCFKSFLDFLQSPKLLITKYHHIVSELFVSLAFKTCAF